MDEHVTTAIGRVVPSYTGTWVNNKVYDKLDNVLYNGSTYVALKSVPAGIQPDSDSNRWQLIARKGDVGNISHVYASAVPSDQPTASATISGTPDDVTLEFEFGLPKGDTGDPAAITHVNATASQIGYNDPPQVTATITGDPGDATLDFAFFIPGGEGSVSSVDGVSPLGGNVALKAVSFGANQTEDPNSPRYISPQDAARARDNIGAVSREIKINTYPLITDIDLNAADVGAVPTSRTINTKPLSSNITLNAADVGAVPTSRTVNGKALSSNISLTATDVGAYVKPSSGIPASDLASGVIPTVPSKSTVTPIMDGTAAIGTSNQWAAANHVHPKDTTKQDKITANGILKGNGSGGVSAATAGTDYITPATLQTNLHSQWNIQDGKTSYSIGATDVNKTIRVNQANTTVTLTQSISTNMASGTEIGILTTSGNSAATLTVVVPSGRAYNQTSSFTKVKISGCFAFCTIKKMWGATADVWLVTAPNLEVLS